MPEVADKVIEFELPYPPSVNHYWRGSGKRIFLSKEAVAFRAEVWALVKQRRLPRLDGRLSLAVWVYPPDRRRRDLDNILKALLDALEHAELYDDDSQIDYLAATKCAHDGKGRVIVQIGRMADSNG